MDYEAIKKVTHQQAASMTYAEQISIGMFVCSIVVVMYFLLLNFLLVIIGDAMVKTLLSPNPRNHYPRNPNPRNP